MIVLSRHSKMLKRTEPAVTSSSPKIGGGGYCGGGFVGFAFPVITLTKPNSIGHYCYSLCSGSSYPAGWGWGGAFAASPRRSRIGLSWHLAGGYWKEQPWRNHLANRSAGNGGGDRYPADRVARQPPRLQFLFSVGGRNRPCPRHRLPASFRCFRSSFRRAL